MWVWVCEEVYLLVYLGACIPDRHRHVATTTYQHHAWITPTHPHPHSTSTHFTNNVQTFAHYPIYIFRNFPFIHFSCWTCYSFNLFIYLLYLCIHSFIYRFIYLFFHFIYLFMHFLFFMLELFWYFLPVGKIYLEFLRYKSVHVLFILFEFIHNLISF